MSAKTSPNAMNDVISGRNADTNEPSGRYRLLIKSKYLKINLNTNNVTYGFLQILRKSKIKKELASGHSGKNERKQFAGESLQG